LVTKKTKTCVEALSGKSFRSAVKKKKAKMGLLMNSMAQGLTSSTLQPQNRNPELLKSALADAM
jgi:hypothetical protein